MLGRNQIQEIENLECLPHLDVLDLQQNHIRKICNSSLLIIVTKLIHLHHVCVEITANLRHLKSLRILNLSNNCIKAIENLEGLVSLVELNVCSNKVCCPRSSVVHSNTTWCRSVRWAVFICYQTFFVYLSRTTNYSIKHHWRIYFPFHGWKVGKYSLFIGGLLRFLISV